VTSSDVATDPSSLVCGAIGFSGLCPLDFDALDLELLGLALWIFPTGILMRSDHSAVFS